MTEKTLSSKDFAVADVFENGADSLVGSKEENDKLIAQSQKSGPSAKLAAAALAKRYPEQAERVENPLNIVYQQEQQPLYSQQKGPWINGRNCPERG